MLAKIKKWFSIENNVNLVRDVLFIGSLLLALVFGLVICTPVAYASEVDTPTEATEVDEVCLTIPVYEVDGTIYSPSSVKIPYDYTDEIVAYHWNGDLFVLAFDFDTEEGYFCVQDDGEAIGLFVGGSKCRFYTYCLPGGSGKVWIEKSYFSTDGHVNDLAKNDFKIVYSSSDVINKSDGGVYVYATNSFASLMSGLFSFGENVVDLWGSISDFATDNIYVFLPLLAWLLVMAFGGLFKLFKA